MGFIIIAIIVIALVLTEGSLVFRILGWLFMFRSWLCDLLKIKWKHDPSKRENWITIDVVNHPQEVGVNWTYKRNVGQNFYWMFFGNDHGGCVPYFDDEQRTFWWWWRRNSCINYEWHVVGYANWVEGEPNSVWDVSHLEVHRLLPELPDHKTGFDFFLVKPKIKPWYYWRPYIGMVIDFGTRKLDIHWGWRTRGFPAAGITIKKWD